MNTPSDRRPAAFDPANLRMPFTLDVNGKRFQAETLLRHLPGKRIVCAGQWDGRDVVAKIYIDPLRSRIHADREAAGVAAMQARGIVTPLLLSRTDGPQPAALLFEYIPFAYTARDRWVAAQTEDERKNLLGQLVVAVASHHHAGMVQEDLHLGNFIFAERKLYTLDGGSIRTYRHEVPAAQAIANLALLFAQFEPATDRFAESLLDEYCRVYDKLRGSLSAEQILDEIKRRRERRKSEYLRKCFRTCSAFQSDRDWGTFKVWDREYDSAALRQLLRNPDSYLESSRLLKEGRTSTVGVVRIDNRALLIKRYNIKSAWHAVKRALRQTRAAVSWRNGHRLRFYAIPTARPVALVERRWGPLRSASYIICEYIDAEDCGKYLRSEDRSEPEKQRVVDQIVELFSKMARLNIGHGDTKASNFLVSAQAVSTIDLDAMHEYRDPARAAHAHREDIERFLQNWETTPDLKNRFLKQFSGGASTA